MQQSVLQCLCCPVTGIGRYCTYSARTFRVHRYMTRERCTFKFEMFGNCHLSASTIIVTAASPRSCLLAICCSRRTSLIRVYIPLRIQSIRWQSSVQRLYSGFYSMQDLFHTSFCCSSSCSSLVYWYAYGQASISDSRMIAGPIFGHGARISNITSTSLAL